MIFHSNKLKTSLPVRSEIFYDERNRILADVILELLTSFDEDEGLDPVILNHHLGELQLLDRVGGLVYLNDIYTEDLWGSAVNINQYVQILDKLHERRESRIAGYDLLRGSSDPQVCPQEIARQAQQRVEQAAPDPQLVDQTSSSTTTVELVRAEYAAAKELAAAGRRYAGLDTGFIELSERLNGLRKSELTILGARPGVGKTTLALEIACHASRQEQARVGVISLEMSQAQIGRRVIDLLGGLDPARHARGLLNADEELRKSAAENELARMDLRVYSGCQHPEKLTEIVRSHSCDLWIVDHLHMIRGERSSSRHNEITEYCQQLKDLTVGQEVPMLLLCQLNRDLEKTLDKRPHIEHLRESGSIEECADNVLLLWRPGIYPELIAREPGLETLVEINAAKLRYGVPGPIPLEWDPAKAIFKNRDRRLEFV